ncbi:MAG TPA: phytanoyl-CoA dioxygenase family protein [Caulobacteraceae bacterium]|jgi:hypothetical protein|nr:phytanoyl-CoA dioxygenase family protein [Caulobacteraceae bacterium]
MTIDWAQARATFRRDGVVHLPGVLDADQLGAAQKAWAWSLANPTAAGIASRTSDVFYVDQYNPRVLEGYSDMLAASPIPSLCARLWDSEPVWFLYEQVFLKEGGKSRRTPWHQDGSYLPLDGEDVAVAWITFDALARDESLEFARGSHRGQVYNTSKFDPGDETIPHVESEAWPRLPPIEAERQKWDIACWPVEPGDVIFFHFRTLHGGAPTLPGRRRRTLSLRFFGERTYYDPKMTKALPNARDLPTLLEPGQPFRHPGFLRVHP